MGSFEWSCPATMKAHGVQLQDPKLVQASSNAEQHLTSIATNCRESNSFPYLSSLWVITETMTSSVSLSVRMADSKVEIQSRA